MAACGVLIIGFGCSPASPGEGVATDRGLILQPVATIGCSDCQGVAQINPLFLTLTSRGEIWMTDQYEPFVRVFDSAGNLIRAFGTKGEGPGEMGMNAGGQYIGPIGVYPNPDGSFWVYDVPFELILFDASAESVLTTQLSPRVGTNHDYDPVHHVLWVSSITPLDDAGPRIERYDLVDFATRDGTPTAKSVVVSDPSMFPIGSSGRPTAQFAFTATPDGGFAIGYADSYTVAVFDGDGNPVREFGRAIPRIPKSESELEEEREQARRFAERFGREPREVDPLRLHFTAGALDYDDDGRLWVLTLRGKEGQMVFDVFDAEGELVSEVFADGRAYSSLDPFAVAGEHLAALVADERDNPRVGVWKIRER